MVKVIVHVAKAIATVILSLLFLSCGFDFKSIDGDGNVTSQKRQIAETFTSVKVNRGLELIIVQGSEQSVTVEADGNLQQHIKTEVKGHELEITADTNIGSGSKTITVVVPAIKELTSESSASIKSKSALKVDELKLSASSGSNIQLSLDAKEIESDASSGAHIEISGVVEKLETDVSSGSSIEAKNLKAQHVKASASSGGQTTVNPIKKLDANASSGGKIIFANTPDELKKDASSGGSVSQL